MCVVMSAPYTPAPRLTRAVTGTYLHPSEATLTLRTEKLVMLARVSSAEAVGAWPRAATARMPRATAHARRVLDRVTGEASGAAVATRLPVRLRDGCQPAFASRPPWEAS